MGREIHGGWSKTPISPPSKHQQHLSVSLYRVVVGGTSVRRAPSTSLPSFSQRRRSSALIPPQVYVGETLHVEGDAGSLVTYFQVRVVTQSLRPPWRIRSQTRRQCSVAFPVCSTGGAKNHSVRSSQKVCTTQVNDSDLDLIIFQSEVWSQEVQI